MDQIPAQLHRGISGASRGLAATIRGELAERRRSYLAVYNETLIADLRYLAGLIDLGEMKTIEDEEEIRSRLETVGGFLRVWADGLERGDPKPPSARTAEVNAGHSGQPERRLKHPPLELPRQPSDHHP